MLKILTITLNPCIDKSIAVNGLYADRKLHCKLHSFEPGGGGINVSRAIQNLGGTSECWFLQGGYHGLFFLQLIRHKLRYKSFAISNETRENIIVHDESSGAQYLFDISGPIVTEGEWEPILTALQHSEGTDLVVASGSLPPGVPTDFYARLARIAKSKGIKLIVDTAGEPLAHALQEGLYLCKPNLKEFCALTGAQPDNLEDVQLKAQSLIQSGSCEAVVISLGPEGALLVQQQFAAHIPAPAVQKKSTVGAGDSMLAGIVYQLSIGSDLRKAVAYGVASGAAATVSAGTALCTKANTEHFFAIVQQNFPIK